MSRRKQKIIHLKRLPALLETTTKFEICIKPDYTRFHCLAEDTRMSTGITSFLKRKFERSRRFCFRSGRSKCVSPINEWAVQFQVNLLGDVVHTSGTEVVAYCKEVAETSHARNRLWFGPTGPVNHPEYVRSDLLRYKDRSPGMYF